VILQMDERLSMSWKFAVPLLSIRREAGTRHGPFIADISLKRSTTTTQKDKRFVRSFVRSFADDFECTPMLPPGKLKIRKVKIVAKPNVVVGANVFVSRPNHGENFRRLLILISYNTYN
jgi:hypothetical protein